LELGTNAVILDENQIGYARESFGADLGSVQTSQNIFFGGVGPASTIPLTIDGTNYINIPANYSMMVEAHLIAASPAGDATARNYMFMVTNMGGGSATVSGVIEVIIDDNSGITPLPPGMITTNWVGSGNSFYPIITNNIKINDIRCVIYTRYTQVYFS